MSHRVITASRSLKLRCLGWEQEAALRMLMNNLDPEVAEKPQELVVYGGSGKAARNWQAYDAIVSSLETLRQDETLLIQSGKPVGVLPTHEFAPRVLISNSMLVPAWANWETFRSLEAQGLTMYGQMTAGSWIYIGTQGILQGTYETFGAVAKKHFGGSLKGRLVLTAGLGGMGGAQPLAVTMNQGVALVAEVDEQRIKRRIETGYLDARCDNLDEALSRVKKAMDEGKALSVGICMNAADLYEAMLKRSFIPDVVTDQTSAHDLLLGYVPANLSTQEADELRQKDSKEYLRLSAATVCRHVSAMLDLKTAGSIVFDYGNNIRQEAKNHGVENAFDFPGFVPAYIRELFCEGQGPFRWVALSGDPADIAVTDAALIKAFPEKTSMIRWLKLAAERVHFQGLPARICWLGYGERQKAGEIFHALVKSGQVKAPIVIGRDHLDCGSVASPNRETESMRDGSDAIADWPMLNAMVNVASGASWVSIHHGGGVGMGYSLHAGMVVVADGSDESLLRLRRVLNADPAMGVIRHADAGYETALSTAKRHKMNLGANNPSS